MVVFESKSAVEFQLQPLGTAQPKGGTYFVPAIQMAEGIIRKTPTGYTPIFIFMSGGCDEDGSAAASASAEAAMQKLHSRYKHLNLQTHVIAFGDADTSKLQSMATYGKGQFHQECPVCSSGRCF